MAHKFPALGLGPNKHPTFSLSTRPDKRILSYEHNGTEITVTPSVKGLATLHDKDILIYCISQLMVALNAGPEISRTLTLRAYDLLVARNMVRGGQEVTTGFGLIESWQIVRASRGGRMVSVSVVLSEWLLRAVESKSVLTLSTDYF